MTQALPLQLDIACEDDRWQENLSSYETLIQQALFVCISHTPEGKSLKNFAHLELSILLANDETVHELNKQYRDKDKSTNILSFPGLDQSEQKSYLREGAEVPDFPYTLGDMVLAFETLEREAEEAHKNLQDHFCHLIVHGFLHLLGYDHISDVEAEQMETLERLILAELSIDDPYKIMSA